MMDNITRVEMVQAKQRAVYRPGSSGARIDVWYPSGFLDHFLSHSLYYSPSATLYFFSFQLTILFHWNKTSTLWARPRTEIERQRRARLRSMATNVYYMSYLTTNTSKYREKCRYMRY